MKNIYFIISFWLLFNLNSIAQYNHEWASWYNYSGDSFDYSNSIEVDSSGNSYVTGSSYDPITNYDISTIKYNSIGIKLWEARFNGVGNGIDAPSAMAVDNSGNVYVTGHIYGGSSDYDCVTIKYNTNGIFQWSDIYNGAADSTDKGKSIVIDNSGNAIMCGWSYKPSGTGSSNPDCITIKYNPSGSRLWTKSYEYQLNSNDSGCVINTDISGNSYIAVHEGGKVILIKYNSAGSLFWSRMINTPSSDIFYDMVTDKNGNSYIHLRSDSIYKINSSGIISWRKMILNTVPTDIQSLYKFNTMGLDSTGNLHVLYRSYSNFSYTTFSVNKYDANGNVLWISSFAFPILWPYYFYPMGICTDKSGNVFVNSIYQFFSTDIDIHTVKFNSSGIKQWSARYYNISFPNSPDIPTDLITDNSGNLYLSGYGVQLGSEFDYLTIKYPSSVQLNSKTLIEAQYDSALNILRIKDTITAYLRDVNSPFVKIDSGKAVLDSLNFKAGFCFNNAESGSYYIELKHRNSLETWSRLGGETFFKKSPTYYDFTLSDNQAYGQNMKISNGKYCLFSGDVDKNGTIDGSDLILIDNDAFNFNTGYLKTDLTGDYIVDGSDFSIADNNAANFVSLIRP